MSTLFHPSASETAVFLRTRRLRKRFSKTRLWQVLQMTVPIGLLLVLGMSFISFQAIAICSASLKASFCP